MAVTQISNSFAFKDILKNKINIPAIEPVFSGIQRPLWSVMIPTYNGTRYLEQTLKSLLEQDPGSEQMQIEVVDDCSTQDNPEALVKEIGEGRISFFRNPTNQGLIGNWNICIQRSTGHWVHILHQDDIALPGFYNRLAVAVESSLNIGAAFCRHVHIDEYNHWCYQSPLEQETSGILENWIEKIAVAQLIQFPSIVVKRKVYENLGGFCAEAYYAADWEMWKRIASCYHVWYEPEILACYRRHSNSETSRLVRSGSDIADIRKAIDITHSYLPLTCADTLSQQAKKHYAFYALNTARQMLIRDDLEGAISQIKEALRCNLSFSVLRYAFGLLRRKGINCFSKKLRLR